jgi:hypothetical protein
MNKIILLSVLVFYPTYAFAYIDPGTVSILIQGLIGALAATIVTLKIYWYKISKFFNIGKKKNTGQENKNKDIK